MQVIAGAARRHLGYQLGSASNVPIGIDVRLSPALWRNEQQRVRLRLIIQIQPDGTVIPYFHTRRNSQVVTQPTNEMRVRRTMLTVTCGGWHVDDSFNQLGLFQVWHRLIAAFKLSTRQSITAL
jgi:hypothetical protein